MPENKDQNKNKSANNNDKNKKNVKVDDVSGVETTGHQWDGLEELNNPLPRWWVWVFIITIVFSVGYWVVFPAWPTLEDHTKGKFGWTQLKQLKQQQSDILARKEKYAEAFKEASLSDIKSDPELYAFAYAGGRIAFKEHCAACHGTGASGIVGKYPNLNDDDWIWGGSLDSIYETIKYGIRSSHDDTRISDMPAFGDDEMLTGEQITKVVNHILSLSGMHAEDVEGAVIFAENCASCHGELGRGDVELGAPNLADALWLYGDDRESITKTVASSRAGMMPHWEGRLSEETIKQLVVYVHSLGGGE